MFSVIFCVIHVDNYEYVYTYIYIYVYIYPYIYIYMIYHGDNYNKKETISSSDFVNKRIRKVAIFYLDNAVFKV